MFIRAPQLHLPPPSPFFASFFHCAPSHAEIAKTSSASSSQRRHDVPSAAPETVVAVVDVAVPGRSPRASARRRAARDMPSMASNGGSKPQRLRPQMEKYECKISGNGASGNLGFDDVVLDDGCHSFFLVSEEDTSMNFEC